MKKTRSMICIFLSLLIVMLIGGCGLGSHETETENVLYEQGLDIVDLLVEMVNNETYLKMFTADTEVLDLLSSAAQGVFASVDRAYVITAGEDFYDGLTELSIMDELSPALQKSIKSRAMASQMAQVNAYGGADCLAASSICTVNRSFVDDRVKEDAVYIYTFADAAPVSVAFTVGEDGAVSATGNFILYDGAVNATAEELKELFGLAVHIEEIR